MEPVEQLSYVLPTLSSVVDGIDPGRLHETMAGRTATLRDVLDEMIVLGHACACWFRGLDDPDLPPPAAPGRVPAGEYRAAMDELLAAVKAPGACDGVRQIPGGPIAADTLARSLALDGLLHGWDIAPFSRRRFEVPPGVIAAADAFAQAHGEWLARSATAVPSTTTWSSPSTSSARRFAVLAGRSA